MQIDWWTLVLQAINFFVLVWLLWRFLFRPVKAIIARRQEAAEQAAGKLEDARQDAVAEKERLAADRQTVAEERKQLINKLHEELAREREDILDDARAQARGIIDDAKKAAKEDRRRAKDDLKSDIAALAAEMAAHLLEKASPEVYTTLLLDQLRDRLAGLSDAEKSQLLGNGAEEGASLLVTTAQPLDEAGRNKWSESLRDALPQVAAIDFKEDPDLIAGAELRLPHGVLRFSWADQLRQAQAEMRAEDETGGR